MQDFAMLLRHAAGDLDGFVALDSKGGTTRSFARYCADIAESRRRFPCRFAHLISDVLDRPRAPSLSLCHQNMTSYSGSGSRCFAFRNVPSLSTYKVRRTKRHDHERSREPENRFGETPDGCRVDHAKNERLQVGDTTQHTVRTGYGNEKNEQKRAHREDLPNRCEHAQPPEDCPGVWAALPQTLEDANCEALQRGVGTSGEGRDTSEPSKY